MTITCPICTSDPDWCDCVYHLESPALDAYYTSIQLQKKENN